MEKIKLTREDMDSILAGSNIQSIIYGKTVVVSAALLASYGMDIEEFVARTGINAKISR